MMATMTKMALVKFVPLVIAVSLPKNTAVQKAATPSKVKKPAQNALAVNTRIYMAKAVVKNVQAVA